MTNLILQNSTSMDVTNSLFLNFKVVYLEQSYRDRCNKEKKYDNHKEKKDLNENFKGITDWDWL